MTAYLSFSPNTETPTAVVPVSGISSWTTVVLGLATVDLASGETVAQSPEVAYTNHSEILRGDFNGTTLRIRLVYPDDALPYGDEPPLTIRLFGTTGSAMWTVLRNLNGDASVPFPVDPPYTGHPGSDTRGTVPGSEAGGFLINQPDNNMHSWDCQGYDRFLIAIEKPFLNDAESGESAYLQMMIV